MDKEQLSDAIGNISDKHIEEANKNISDKRTRVIKTALAVAAAILLAVTAVIALPKLIPGEVTPGVTTTRIQEEASSTDAAPSQTEPLVSETAPVSPVDISYAQIEAQYPEEHTPLYEWNGIRETALGYRSADAWKDGTEFTQKILGAFFDTEENTVFSPFSLYQSLATLAEISSGNTRAQILRLLNAPSIEALRTTARAMWLNAYCKGQYYGDDGIENEETQYCIPANSLWLNSTADVTGDAAVADILKNDYYTSFYKGDPADEGFQEAYRCWMNAQTGNLLEDAVKDKRLDDGFVFSLVNTLFLQASWTEEFYEGDNTIQPFYGADGTRDAEFMHNSFFFLTDHNSKNVCFKGNGFSAVCVYTKANKNVWLLLPDENNDLSNMISSAQYAQLLNALKDKNGAFVSVPDGYNGYQIDLSLPKFDLTGSFDLKQKLIDLGITDAFDPEKADIPFIQGKDGSNVCVSSASQDVRVNVNEKGISAAAITSMGYGWGDPVFYKVDFTLNRPFLMLVTSDCATPLFAAAVYNAQ